MNRNAVVPRSRRAILGTVLFVCLCISLLLMLAACKAVRSDDAAKLVGSWRLVSYEDREGGGTPVFPYSRAPAGLLVYDATPHMAVQMMKVPPPDVATDDWDRFTTQEKVALFDGYVAYFGRFEVDSTRKVVRRNAKTGVPPRVARLLFPCRVVLTVPPEGPEPVPIGFCDRLLEPLELVTKRRIGTTGP